jgi:hypothetical protein
MLNAEIEERIKEAEVAKKVATESPSERNCLAWIAAELSAIRAELSNKS